MLDAQFLVRTLAFLEGCSPFVRALLIPLGLLIVCLRLPDHPRCMQGLLHIDATASCSNILFTVSQVFSIFVADAADHGLQLRNAVIVSFPCHHIMVIINGAVLIIASPGRCADPSGNMY